MVYVPVFPGSTEY